MARWILLLCLGFGFGLAWAQNRAWAQEIQLPTHWRWSNPQPFGGNIFDLSYGLGLAVAVTERGQIFTSEDLEFWEPRRSGTTNSLRAVTFFGDRLIITGERGTVLWADSLQDF